MPVIPPRTAQRQRLSVHEFDFSGSLCLVSHRVICCQGWARYRVFSNDWMIRWIFSLTGAGAGMYQCSSISISRPPPLLIPANLNIYCISPKTSHYGSLKTMPKRWNRSQRGGGGWVRGGKGWPAPAWARTSDQLGTALLQRSIASQLLQLCTVVNEDYDININSTKCRLQLMFHSHINHN